MDVPRRAMRAFQIGLKLVVDQLLRLDPGAPLAQRIDQLPRLGGGQIIDEFRQTAFEFTMFHDRSPF
jgi:hypothetical protein